MITVMARMCFRCFLSLFEVYRVKFYELTGRIQYSTLYSRMPLQQDIIEVSKIERIYFLHSAV